MARKGPKQTIIGIDRGSRYVGVAYTHEGRPDAVIFPVGYIENDPSLYFSLADIFARYNATTVVVGYPSRGEHVQKKIESFITKVASFIDPKITITTIEEDYTTVQAGEVVSSYKKTAATDTVSAMFILQNWQEAVSQLSEEGEKG